MTLERWLFYFLFHLLSVSVSFETFFAFNFIPQYYSDRGLALYVIIRYIYVFGLLF